MKKLNLLLIVLLLILSSSLLAEDKDHPILGRYKGSSLKITESKSFEEFTLPMGKIIDNKFSKTKTLEGKITRKLYRAGKDRTVLEIYKNYLEILKKSDAKILFKGRKGAETGPELGQIYFKTNPMKGQVYNNTLPWEFLVVSNTSQGLIVVKLSANGKDYYVSIIIGTGYEPYTVYQLDIIEVKTMDVNMISSMDIKEDIELNGHATIYGIHFDSGRYDIKAESEPTLKQIAKFLTDNPKNKVYIVGHTDNTGVFSKNMTLSQNRANSVIETLIKTYKINPGRLGAFGVSSLSPLKSNSTDEGKALNRRVEIIEQ
ncbi:MAG: OmpA family protein [Candidatus Delongbacteria bacterium]|nr:OmpA family protein [Candidatus Delongbacteria bacterium]